MSIENEIAGLTQSTTDLLEAVNTKKATLDTAVSNAQTAVTDATSQVSLAAAEKVGAQTARDTAESFKDQAYTYSQSAASAVAYQDLTAIAETKSESAVDVFVYDTTKDSDGGAWRQRTQHTSWYNETLNTATRGSRKEFPAVAVIVAESNKVTIYDGDDPSMPMWMVFNRGATATVILLSTGNLTASTMLNGILSVCSSTNGLHVVSFAEDLSRRGHVSTSYTNVFTSGIINRNGGGAYSSGGGYQIVNPNVNDVAMTVLPDAPIDPATGLPIPTIAVATDGGVSVIKDDGTVVDSLDTGAYGSVDFHKDGHLYLGEIEFSDEAEIVFYPKWKDESFDVTRSYYRPHIPSLFRDESSARVDNLSANAGAFGTNIGLGVFSTDFSKDNGDNTNNPEDMVRYITSEYNTGWMNGDVKLATLSDTDDTDLVGTELVTNGTFDTDISGWTGVTGSMTYDNGTINIQPTNYQAAEQSLTVVAGKSYIVSFDVTATTVSSARIYIGNTSSVGRYVNKAGLPVGSYSFTVKPTTTTLRLSLATTQASANVNFDNISVRLAEPDRSVNNNGLQVFGTVQKSPVATGADLVAYSGFGSNNYLEQPYNSDLDFGTGDFCISYWMYKAASSFAVFSRVSGTGTGYGDDPNYFTHFIDTNLKIRMQGGNIDAPVSTLGIVDYTWTKIDVVRREGVAYVYVNGVQKYTQSYETPNISCPNLSMYLGALYYNYFVNAGVGNKLALFRISGTAPTAEQIEKIYNDEKVLFQEGAQATLYGTSDAVTALTYDDTTELLHVGTSAGRSVFQGLKRVDNTTDAVGTAISASNNLVVEE